MKFLYERPAATVMPAGGQERRQTGHSAGEKQREEDFTFCSVPFSRCDETETFSGLSQGAGERKRPKWISGVPTQPPTETRDKAEEAPPVCFSKESNRMWTVNSTGDANNCKHGAPAAADV